MTLVTLTDHGLYCPAGDFYIDPWRPVKRAVITHGHGDHTRAGSDSYLCSAEGAGVVQRRIHAAAQLQPLPYGETLRHNGVSISLHPSGHILGSAQVRIEAGGEVWVVSGDYKTEPDATCTGFEPLRCHTFITESTFGLPVFRWRSQSEVFAEINAWWRRNRQQGRTSILYAYALGKAQRLLAGLDENIGPLFTHGAVETFNRIYRDAGIRLAPTRHVGQAESRKDFTGALVIAPPSADNPGWLRRFPSRAKAFASGWMQIRGHRRRRAVDRGFVLSDHADWDGLNRAVAATGARTVWTTHGYAAEYARWLQERGYRTEVLSTRFTGETDEEVPEEGDQRQPTDSA